MTLQARHKPLEPLVKPPPVSLVAAVAARRREVTYTQSQPGTLQGVPAATRPFAVPAVRRRLPQRRLPPPWAMPAMDTPAAPRKLDRSLSTNDIAGARPRRLVSIENRARY